MNKTAITAIIIFAFIISFMAGMQTLEVAKANFLPAPVVALYSPFGLYTNTSVPLSVVIRVLHDSPRIVRVLYSLDGKLNVTLTNLTRTDNVWFDPNKWGSVFSITSVLENLAEGNHTLNVYSQDAAGKEMSSSVEFTINTQYRYPEVLILSPQNKTYNTTEVPLTWTCDEQIVSADYNLDILSHTALYGFAGNTSLPGNTTLTGLSNGTHTITVNVFTERGFASQTAHFTISPETQLQPEPFPTTIIAAACGASVAIIGIGLFLYSNKRGRGRNL